WTARAGPALVLNFQCVSDNGSAYTKAGGISGFVRYHMQQPGSDAHCMTGERDSPLAEMQHMNHVTRGGTYWSQPGQDGDRHFASFKCASGDNCRAFIAYGPPAASPYVVNKPYVRHGTYQFLMGGYICRSGGMIIDDDAVKAYIESVQLKTQ